MDYSNVYYNFRKYEKTVEFNAEIIGDTDFTNGAGSIVSTKYKTKAIVLPLSISREFFKGQITQDDKFERHFFLKLKDVEVFPSYYIIYDSERYNTKDLIKLDNTYSLLVCSAVRGEPTYEQ